MTNWKKSKRECWIIMLVLEKKSISSNTPQQRLHHKTHVAIMYSRNAIHLIRLQNVSVQPWTPHLTASVAPRDCGALCRSVRIKPRFASTRRPTPSEDPVSKASTISIGIWTKKKKTRCFEDGLKMEQKHEKCKNLAESICAMCFFCFQK